jgi:hypothetical protein
MERKYCFIKVWDKMIHVSFKSKHDNFLCLSTAKVATVSYELERMWQKQ